MDEIIKNTMTKEELKNKYGIELIGKEMWVWDEDPKDAKLDFVTFKALRHTNYPFKTGNINGYANASKTNPNEPQDPQVGDIGYFWDSQKAYAYGAILKIYENQTHKYAACTNSFFINFSKEKQPWMK
jgi:hypothetical protein